MWSGVTLCLLDVLLCAAVQVWMCGGKVLISTCSRVGHVFRKVSPYTWPGGVVNILNHNTMRTAEVWMDKHKEFFYKVNPCESKFCRLYFSLCTHTQSWWRGTVVERRSLAG